MHEPKSLEAFDVPFMWHRETRCWLSVDKNVDTREDAEKCPLRSFSNASMHGLLSDKHCKGCSDSRINGEKCLTPAVMARASCSHGSQLC